MCHTFIHGDNHIKSRGLYSRKIDEHKNAGVTDIIHLDIPKITETDIIQSTEAASLFGTQKLLLIENCFKKRDTKKHQLLFQQLQQPGIHSLFWLGKKLTAAQQKQVVFTQIIECKTDPIIFKFLESIGQSTIQQTLQLYHQAVMANSPDFVFHMLIRHNRELLRLQNQLDIKPSWKTKKLKPQAQSLGKAKTYRLHAQLHQLDWQIKSGQLIGSIKDTLEVTLIQLDSRS